MDIINGRPHSPYFVFIKGFIGDDSELLEELDLRDYVAYPKIKPYSSYITITRDSVWTHICDSWLYTHWHSERFKNRITNLSHSYDLFSFSVGDSDNSFEFILYEKGTLVRHVVWDDPNYDGGYLKDNFGKELAVESTISLEQDPVEGLWTLVESLGIKIDYGELELKSYGERLSWVSRLRDRLS